MTGRRFYVKKLLQMTDKNAIEDAVKFVSDGMEVIFPVEGDSMLPFIIGGKDSVVLTQPVKILKRRVYLAWTEGGYYVIHRIEKIKGNRIKLMGDGNLKNGEYCNIEDIKAYVRFYVSKDGKRHYLYSLKRRILVRIWLFLKPLRRFILFIYKKFRTNED